MKTLTLKLGEKVYTTGRITAWQSREALAVQKDMLAIANTGNQISKNDLTALQKFMEDMDTVTVRKANLVCDVYGGKFTIDELQKALSNEEIEQQLMTITQGISGIVTKN